jgi:hypothetical protein
MNVPNDFREQRMLLKKRSPVPLLKEVTVLPQLPVHVASVLARQPLHEAPQRLVRNLKCEMNFTRSPAKRVNPRSAAPNAAFNELRETHIVRGVEKDISALVAMEDHIVKPTWNM